ncbi:hypothetical protein DRN86_05680 [Candidatus Geothermarchaeota archaeon]|nr:MAG: hypothetical protein DRN86_05680 [Candidatus Geothermarchaeota archaeon]
MLFLEEFSRNKCGIEVVGDTAWLVSSIKTPRVSGVVHQLHEAIEVLKKVRGEVSLKVQVTGPLTLASVTQVTDKMVALSYESVVEEFIDAVTGIVDQLSEPREVKVVFIDEPSLPYASFMGVEEDLLIKAISKPLSKAAAKGKLVGVHVCGDIRGFASILLQTSAKILHHEFKGFPRNLAAYSRRDLESYDKLLGLGCVQTVPKNGDIEVESVDEVVGFIKHAGEVFGFERLFLAPDCGFKGFRQAFGSEDEAQRTAVLKMRLMSEAAELVRTTIL